jgi:hypothetical protein
MAIILLNLGLASQPQDDLGGKLQDTLKIIFHQSGTFYSPDAGNFTPPLPHGVFFQQGETWPDSGGAKPNCQAQTRYMFQASSSPVPSTQAAGGGTTGGPFGYNVIHIP